MNSVQMEVSITPAPAAKVINAVYLTSSDRSIGLRNLWFRLFTPNSIADKPLPLIVYIHGGGFSEFGPDTKAYDDLCSNLAAKASAVVTSVNYRLTPQHKYPSQYNDVYDALKFMDTAYLPTYTDRSNCFIAGDSAGGNIAHHVAVKALTDAKHFKKIRVVGVVCLQPFFGGEERTESELRLPRHPFFNVDNSDRLWRDFLPEGANRNHPAAHVFGGECGKKLRKLKSYPPTLVIMGENDLLLDWQKRYVEWLKESCGKRVEEEFYEKTEHGFYLYKNFGGMPVFRLLFKRLADFIQDHQKPKKSVSSKIRFKFLSKGC